MNSNSPCPIEQLLARSEEHFIDRRSDGAAIESFEQLAQRRVKNLVFLDSLLFTLAEKAPSPDQLDLVYEARAALEEVIAKIRQAILGR